ncbi:MAG: rhomboid family intramembrane serine protease [Phycisphaerae bacterium]
MLIPIRTDYRMTTRPWVNYAFVAANILLFVLGYPERGGQGQIVSQYLLKPDQPELFHFFSSMFLHGGWSHLLGNMVFLWVFGNALNDRFGHLGYLAFYLAGGLVAGIGYIMLGGDRPVLGASGAIASVTGAYLVLFPRTRVTLLVWFWIIYTFEISSLLFLLFQFAFDAFMTLVVLQQAGGGGVAYSAHLAGSVFGIATASIMLALRLLPRDQFDLLNLVHSHRRRSKFRRMVAQGYQPFNNSGFNVGSEGWSPPQKPASEPEAREAQLRREISQACARHDVNAAAVRYLELIQIADDVVLSLQNQLDVANQLMASEQYPAAADAYERLVRNYPKYEYLGDIYLILGIIYSRYLHQYKRARTCLEQAAEKLDDENKIRMAQEEIKAVQGKKR